MYGKTTGGFGKTKGIAASGAKHVFPSTYDPGYKAKGANVKETTLPGNGMVKLSKGKGRRRPY